MSQENVDALRAVYDEWGNGNFRAGVDLYDPEVVFVQGPLAFAGTSPTTARKRGSASGVAGA
jgi:hypothetical protein